MFNASSHAFIDGVSDFKLKFVEQTVQHDGIKNALNSFVEAQRKYTKTAADAGMQSMMSLGLIFSSKTFYDDATEQLKSMVPTNNMFKTTKAKAKKVV